MVWYTYENSMYFLESVLPWRLLASFEDAIAYNIGWCYYSKHQITTLVLIWFVGLIKVEECFLLDCPLLTGSCSNTKDTHTARALSPSGVS